MLLWRCIATRRRPVMDVEIGHRITCWSHLGNIAYLLGRKLRWDPVAEHFLGDEEADRAGNGLPGTMVSVSRNPLKRPGVQVIVSGPAAVGLGHRDSQ